jgi:hypothetical protein
MSIDQTIPPPLLVAPLASLSPNERDEFNKEVLDLGKVADGMVVSIPFPITMYHRIDGIWIPVADLGSFHSHPPAPASDETHLPSVACEDADED